MKQKEFPLNPAALHLGILLLLENGVAFDFPQKMNETKFAKIYNRFCEKFGDAYSSSYNGLYYNDLSGEYSFPFNKEYAIACLNASPFYKEAKNVIFQFKDHFTKLVIYCSGFETIISELFPQRFDLEIIYSKLNSKKGRIFRSTHKFLTLEREIFLERLPSELSKNLLDATKFALNLWWLKNFGYLLVSQIKYPFFCYNYWLFSRAFLKSIFSKLWGTG